MGEKLGWNRGLVVKLAGLFRVFVLPPVIRERTGCTQQAQDNQAGLERLNDKLNIFLYNENVNKFFYIVIVRRQKKRRPHFIWAASFWIPAFLLLPDEWSGTAGRE